MLYPATYFPPGILCNIKMKKKEPAKTITVSNGNETSGWANDQ